MSDGPFTDDMVRHAVTTVQTQAGIIRYAESMAQILAEAGRASSKATGDSVDFAINQWSAVILKRAKEIAAAEQRKKKLLAQWDNDANS